MNPLRELKAVEILSTGRHNAEDFTESDLDDLVVAFDRVGYKVPLTLGHVDAPDAPAVGWVTRIWRHGGKLLADFEVQDAVLEAVKQRRFGQISSEIFTNLRNAAGVFKKALKAVALLGASVPAVPGLRPAWENLAAMDFEAEKVYTTPFNLGGGAMSTERRVLMIQGREAKVVGEEVLRFMLEAADRYAIDMSTTVGWDRCFAIVQRQEPALVARYAQGEA